MTIIKIAFCSLIVYTGFWIASDPTCPVLGYPLILCGLYLAATL